VAEQLNKETDVEVEMVKGGLLELSVHIDDRKVIETNRFWYSRPTTILTKTVNLLTKQPD
jgi:hypothetical protein